MARAVPHLRTWRWVAIGLGATALRAAGLDWWGGHFAGTLEPLQPSMEVAFGFANPSNQAVTIIRVVTNCDCLAATTDRTVYQPGETGLLTARLVVGERTGRYHRTITVTTDDGAPPRKLTLAVEVPAPATIEPGQFEWPVATELRERTADVRPVAGLEIFFDAAVPGNAAFRARLETVEPGRHYRLHVQPVGHDPASASIRLTGRTRNGTPAALSAFATVH